jgi:hypothetical protein
VLPFLFEERLAARVSAKVAGTPTIDVHAPATSGSEQ